MLERVERGFFKSRIQLSSANSMGGKPTTPGQPTSLANPDVQILRVGKFNHPKYGEFAITQAVLSEMKQNFDNKIRGVDIALDYFHESDKEASGWLTEVYLSEDGDELWGKVDWTPAAQQKLQEREIRYFSPDFAFQWQDPETDVVYKNVLFGGGLTNRPFVKDMAAIVAAEQKEEQMKLDELEKMVLKLAEDGKGLQAAHDAMKAENEAMKKKLAEYAEKKPAADPAPADAPADPAAEAADKAEDDSESVDGLKKKLAEADGQKKALEKELMEMKEGKKLAEKEAKFNVLLSEGKACAAQKDAFIKGDMENFVKLSQPVNLEGRGSAANGGTETGDLEDRILKLAEEKSKANPKLSRVEAINLAQREIK